MMDCNFKFDFKHFLLSHGIMGLFVSFFSLLLSSQVLALEHWHMPIEKELKTLKVLNRDSQARPLWISGPISEYRDPLEYSYEIPAFGSLEIPLTEFSEFPWIHLKAQDIGVLQMQILTRFETSILLHSGPSLRWKSHLHSASEAVILNLAPFEQRVLINQGDQEIRSLSIPALGKARVTVGQSFSRGLFTFVGEARIAGLAISPQTTKAFAPDPLKTILKPIQSPEIHYFRLNNKGNRQSYVVSISDPALVAQAQLQVRSPDLPQPRILIGEIDYGNGGFNRDFSDARSTPWSWHIKRVLSFAQLASQDCDGSPEMLEELLKPWKENSGVICFWGYRIVEELQGTRFPTSMRRILVGNRVPTKK